MIALTDYQLKLIRDLATPLPREHRAEFLRRVAAQVEHKTGNGALYRIAVQTQRVMLGHSPTPEDEHVVAGELHHG